MGTINDLILSEFDKAGYHVLGEMRSSSIFTNMGKSDFWLIMDDYDIDVEKQQYIADTYGDITRDFKAAAKNTSVLVLKKVETIGEVNKNWAVVVENDKYYFKKYVLLYTDDAWLKLRDEVLNDKDRSISDYLVDTDVFAKLKEDSIDGAYTLLYGIAHKLPFLLVKMKKTKLELAYPSSWSSPNSLEANNWVTSLPDVVDRLEDSLDEMIKLAGNE